MNITNAKIKKFTEPIFQTATSSGLLNTHRMMDDGRRSNAIVYIHVTYM